MIVRAATAADIPALREIARPFFARSHYAGMARMCEATTEQLAHTLLQAGIFLLAELDGTPLGMLGAIVMPMMMDALVLCASEVVFFVREDVRAARGAGRRLLRALEVECRARGVPYVQMHAIASSHRALFSLYRKQGYALTEISYTKAV